ncbi:MAG: phosphoglycerate dehydrogenase [Chloroflexaceae bacterium]|nr:phosphoglycerate dehydrogenase [Chloroflexaceae bacterium]NJO06733.1 phosphoglycerate dehydrogenase [Chloroflexaceae bacterium]
MDRILVTEKIAPAGLEILQQGAEVDVKLNLDKEALLQTLPEYDALVVRSATKVTAEVIAAGTRLRVIGRAGTGVDNIDVDAATQRGIMVVNAPASNNVAVAELTIGLLLAIARQVPQAHLSVQEGKWERTKFMGWEVRDKTLGLLGLGRIGSQVARRARGFEMHILAYDPVVSFDRAGQLGVEIVAIEELLERSDIVSIHVPLVDGTRNLINAEMIARMQPGAVLINASRGGIVDEAALLEALNSGHLGAAALDVFAKEPPENSALIGHPKVIHTPHLGASTAEAQEQTGTDVAEGILAALQGGTPRYAVNAAFVAPEEWHVLQPYIRLGTSMGMVVQQLVEEPVRSYDIEYKGELAEVDNMPVRLAVLQGLLTGTSEQRVTPVNAPLIARDRGMIIAEYTTPELEGYSGLLVIRAHTANGPREFSGTVLRGEPFIVQTDGYWVSFIPSGSLLLTYHHDQPGIIGRVGTLLGEADINISGMYVGRRAPRERAMMVLTVDEPVPADAVNEVRALPGVDYAVALTL